MMARAASINIIAAFHTSSSANGAKEKLARAGVRRSDVRLVAFRTERELNGGGRSDAERDTLVSVSVKDETAAKKARKVLEEAGAERVDAVDAERTLLPPEAEPDKRRPLA